MNKSTYKTGVFFTIGSFFIWGISPLFWKLLQDIDPLQILGFRIILSLCFVGVILLINKNFIWLAQFKDFKKASLIAVSALLLCLNWGTYVWAINNGFTIEVSLGYYINPLLSIVLGLLFLREKLNPLQWLAFGIAFIGVMTLTVLSGRLPWISLILASCFGIYSLFKKKSKLSSLESLGAETLAAFPIGLALLFFAPLLSSQGSGAGISVAPLTWIFVMLSGPVTAIPLFLFGRGAKILPLSTVGFIQFLGPTLQFILGYFVFKEFFPPRYFIAFGFIWLSLIIYIISLNYKKHYAKA